MSLFTKQKSDDMNAFINQNKVNLGDYNAVKKDYKTLFHKIAIRLLTVSGVFFAIGVIIAVILLININIYESMNGSVIGWQTYNIGTGYYKSTVEYIIDGQVYKVKRFGISGYSDSKGDKYKVYYLKDKPEKSFLLVSYTDAISDVFVIMAIFLVTGGASFLISYKLKPLEVFDKDNDIPAPNAIYLREMAAEKARQEALAAEQEQERLRQEALEKEKQAQKIDNKLSPSEQAALAAKDSQLDIQFLSPGQSNIPSKPKTNNNQKKVDDSNLTPAQRAAMAAQNSQMNIAFLSPEEAREQRAQMSENSPKNLKKKQQADRSNLSPAEQAALAAKESQMDIQFLPNNRR